MSYVFNGIVYVPFSEILGQGKLFLGASLRAFCVCNPFDAPRCFVFRSSGLHTDLVGFTL